MSGENKRQIILTGGKGGLGNQHFATSSMQAPKYAQPGQEALELEVRLELKVIADVGLVGFPNVGKSTLLSSSTNATPKIANYHFTTLNPILGVVDLGEGAGFVMADIPGLIEGASEGIGLGHEFLKHIERTKVIIHVVDAAGTEGRDPIADIHAINQELESFNPELLKKPQVIAANKIDAIYEGNNEIIEKLKETFEPSGIKVFPISAVSRQGVFSDCPITSIEIPASVESIEECAFKGCSQLASVTFEKGSKLKTIGGMNLIFPVSFDSSGAQAHLGAFSDCTALTSIEIPASVESIEECAFQGCSQLASVTFEKGSMLKTIGGRVYAYNKDNCRYGAFGAFTGCPITSIEIPASVETIEVAAFQDCSQLVSVTFEKGSKLKTIGGKSVYGGVISGSKVYYYYYGGFASTALQLFVIDAETPPQCNNYAFYGVNSSAVLKVPSKSVIKYKMASEWKNFSSILGLDE